MKKPEPYIVSHAALSDDGLYRYVLLRRWDVRAGARLLLYIMLNPSTADASLNDATIRSCVRLAKQLGYGGIAVVNLFAFRSRDPGALLTTKDVVGPENDAWVEMMTLQATDVVAAWGAFVSKHLDFKRQAGHIIELVTKHKPLHCFATTRAGYPKHPLYLPTESRLVAWRPKLTAWDIAERKLASAIERDMFRVIERA